MFPGMVDIIRTNAKTPSREISDKRSRGIGRKDTNRVMVIRGQMEDHSTPKERTCTKCNHFSTTLSQHRAHIKTRHPNVASPTHFQCHTCDFQGSRMEFGQHLSLFTDHARQLSCGMCDYKTGRPASRYTHYRGVHLNLRDYKCDMCGKCFKRRSHLICHMAKHSNLRDHTCDMCGKSFKQRCHLIRHMAKVCKRKIVSRAVKSIS